MGSTAIGQLLSFLDTITWHRSDVQLSDIRKAVAKHILQKANKGIVNGAQVSRIVAAYVVEGGQAGAVMHNTMRASNHSGRQPWSSLPAAFKDCPYITVTTSAGGIDGYTKVALDISKLLSDAAAATAARHTTTTSHTQGTNLLSATGSTAANTASRFGSGHSSSSTPAQSARHAAPQAHQGQIGPTALQAPSSQQPAPPLPPGWLVKGPTPQSQAQHAAPQPYSSSAARDTPQQHPAAASSTSAAALGALPLQSLRLLPLPDSLAILQTVTMQQCDTAAVVLVPESYMASKAAQQQPLLLLLDHLQQAGLCALDLEFAQARPTQQQQQQQQLGPQASNHAEHSASNVGHSSHSHSPGLRIDVLAMMQLFVPAVDSDSISQPATIYVVEVPQQQDDAADLMSCFHELLEDSTVVKVMHDARCDSSVLQQQFGVILGGVLDTQVLVGAAAMAAAVPASSSSLLSSTDSRAEGLRGSAAAAAGSSSSSGWSDVGRVGLGKLYEAYGCPHPMKATVGKSFDANPRLWCSRPLQPDALQYAADDVRYLLPIAASLLQTLPAVALQLSSINMQLGQPKARVLQLHEQLMPGYEPLLRPNQVGQRLASSSAAGLTPEGLLVHSGLTDICFELHLDRSGRGWYVPSYRMYLSEPPAGAGWDAAHGTGSSAAGPAQALGSGAAVPARLAGVHGDSAYLQQMTAAEASDQHVNGLSSSSTSRVCVGSSQTEAANGVAGKVEAAVSVGGNSSSSSSSKHGLSTVGDPAAAAGRVDEAVYSMMQLLPARLHPFLQQYLDPNFHPSLIEVILYKGREVELRFSDGNSTFLDSRSNVHQALELLAVAKERWQLQDEQEFASDDDGAQHRAIGSSLNHSSSSFRSIHSSLSNAADKPSRSCSMRAYGDMFHSDQRLGVPSTLHRIAAIRNRDNDVIGLTYRIGRHVPGVALMLGDLLSAMKASLESHRPLSLLILGRPGVGKTTLLRDISRTLSLSPELDQDGLGRKVIIVDTSNEIAGDADIMHPCVGRAVRMMVPRREQQAEILVQAVQNHNPQVLIVDEIGTKEEVEAAKTMAPRGALLIGTAHGHSLSDLLRNNVLNPLVGGIREVTLGDVEAKASNKGHKTRLERAGAAPFVALLELRARNTWRLHMDVERSVDAMLAGHTTAHSHSSSSQETRSSAGKHQQQQAAAAPTVDTQLRMRDSSGRVMVKFETPGAAQQALRAAAMVKAAAAAAASATQAAAAAAAAASGFGDPVTEIPAGSADGDEAMCFAAAVGRGGRGFRGGWFVDLFHAGVHKAIEAAADLWRRYES